MNYSIIIPVYNEILKINLLLKRLRPLSVIGGNEIIVIDDGSDDGTEIILKTAPFIRVHRLDINSGKGTAIREGLKIANHDQIILFDGDMELDPKNICDLMILNEKKGVKCVFGNRVRRSFYINPIWSLGNWYFTTIFNIIHKSDYKDILCCVKAFNKRDINIQNLKSVGFDIDIELASILTKNLGEVKMISLPYRRRSKTDGKKLGILDGWLILKYLMKDLTT